MTKVATLRRPRDFVVVTGPAETAVNNISHGDDIGPGAHLEAELSMANLAAKADTMKPVRKDDRPHAVLLGIAVDHHVGVFSGGIIGHAEPCKHDRRADHGAEQDFSKHHWACAAG